MRIVVPLPRPDLAESWEGLLDTLVDRGHAVTVVTSGALADRFRFEERGMRVARSEPFSRAGDLAVSGWRRPVARAFVDIADMVEKFDLADRLLDGGTILMTYANDSEQLRPYMDVARRKGAPVVTCQMTYLFPDLKNYIERDQTAWRKARSWSHRFYLSFRRWLVSFLTGTPMYGGPRRMWGTDADLLFVIDETQGDIFAIGGIAPEKVKATGVPFMDLIYRRRQANRSTEAKERLADGIGLPPGAPTLLVVTKDIASITRNEKIDQGDFYRRMAQRLGEALPDWRLLFKLHPTEKVETYAGWLQGIERVTINRDMNIVDALSISAAVVSVGISTPSYYARLLGLPLVNYRFDGATLDVGHLANFEGTPMVYDLDALVREVSTFSQGGEGDLSPTFDGKGGERIAAIMEERWGRLR